MGFMDMARDFVAGLPEGLQGLGVLLVAAIPMVEGEGAAIIGVLLKINPWIVVPAAVLGNVIAVALLIWAADGTRQTVRRRRIAPASDASDVAATASVRGGETEREARMRERFDRWGVPGVSLLGPWLMVPGHVSGPAMVGFGAERGAVMLWQAVSIVLYTALGAAVAYGIGSGTGLLTA